MKPGMPIEIGGKKFVLPPLGLEGLKMTLDLQRRYAEMSEAEKMDANIETVHAALIRNYPDYTIEEMREEIDAHEVLALAAVMPSLYEKSGMRQRGEAKQGGKKK
jgi:hypothetical protein